MAVLCCHGNQSSDPTLVQNLIEPVPYPSDASVKTWLRLECWLQCGHTDAQMHGWTNGRRLESRPISSPCEPSAQVSKNAQILYIAFVC